MKTVIVIPAREGSTRFPNKPLALIHGKSLLYRTWLIASAVKNVDSVWVATDSAHIQKEAQKWGAKVCMTRIECENGTERTWDAVSQMSESPQIMINLQGDAVLTPPWVVQAVVDEMLKKPEIPWATPATHLSWKQYDEFMKWKAQGRVSGTFVVFDKNYDALYFSKGNIPQVRERTLEEAPIYRHIGLYGYRHSALKQYVGFESTPLEKAERLEQLRALENGVKIRVVPVDYRGRTHWSVDHPNDIRIVEEILDREGEFVL